MRIHFTPSDRSKERLGHVAVAALLALVFWATYGCGESRRERQAGLRTTAGQTTPRSTQTVVEPVDSTGGTVILHEVSFEEAEVAFRDRRYVEAVDLFTAYTQRRPNNPWGHYMLGLSEWKAGQAEQAEAAFGRALELDPMHVKSLLNLSRVLLDQGRAEEALSRIEQALLIDQSSSDGFRLLGRARDQLGLVEDAIEAYWQAILLDDQDAWSMNNLGLIYIRQDRFDEALPPLARATELRGDVAVFQNNLGIALERTGHYMAAGDAYRAALTVDRSYDKASVNLARVETLQEDPSASPVDLVLLARRFADDVERSREPVTADAAPNQEPDSSVGPRPVVSRTVEPDSMAPVNPQ